MMALLLRPGWRVTVEQGREVVPLPPGGALQPPSGYSLTWQVTCNRGYPLLSCWLPGQQVKLLF